MSIKRNFIYNSILTASNFIFPLITYPYVSRVLGVSNIGLCGFTDSIINYFILFSMLGIGATGIREVANNKGNKEHLKKTFSSLILLNIICTTIALLILITAIYFVPKLYENKELMLLGGAKLIFNVFLVEWFFKGLEDFKFITIRSFIVKLLFIIAVFLLVKGKDDVKIYYALMVGTVVFNAILNNWYRKRFISFSFKSISFSPFIKSFFTIGSFLILTSMYTSFNVAYLGFVAGDTEVGYYSTATKLYGILLSVFTALTAVILPRMSSLVSEGRLNEVKQLTSKSYDVLIAFCLPLITISTIFAPQIIEIIAGKGYEGAIIPMRIVMSLMLIIGIEQILVLQLLMPLKQDKAILLNSIVGAFVGILLNLLLVTTYKSIGSSIVWVSSEITVLITAQYSVKKKINLSFPTKKIITNILYAIPMFMACLVIQYYLELHSLTKLIVASSTCGIYFGFIQIFVVKNELILNVIKPIMNRLQIKTLS